MSTTENRQRSRWRSAVGIAVLGASVSLSALAVTATPAIAQNFTNARVADAGLSEVGTRRATGWNQPGECIKSVQRWVAAAGGSFGGGGVLSGYRNSGAAQLGNLNQAVKGDVFQRTDGNDGDWGYAHTVVVVQNYNNGHFWIVQSNAPGTVNGSWRNDSAGLVTENRDWTPTSPAGWYWTAFRFGNVASPAPAPAPAPSSVRYATTGTVNLRTGPGTGYGVVRSVGSGTPIDVTCQARGTNVNGNSIWDRLTGGEWVADYWTNTPGFNTLSPPNRWC